MEKWLNLDKIIKNRDYIILDNEEVQGEVKAKDLPKVIEKYNLDKLHILTYEKERDILSKIYYIDYLPDGTVEERVLFFTKQHGKDDR